MEILKLTFENLNSLTGAWEIDFTDEAFHREGIFAITGPTGVGKSTLLDAVCLALYGKTPRLKNISNTQNEIMSLQAGRCSAGVTFRTKEGDFRASFSQRRAGDRPDGNLQMVKREFARICNLETGEAEILSDQKTQSTRDLVEEYIGLDFNQFTRAVLLSQGNFADFLNASSSERATILERLTKTDIYSKISQKIYERQGVEASEFKFLEAKLEGITFLSSEEMAKKEIFLVQLQQVEKTLETYLNETQKLLNWREKLAELETKQKWFQKEKIDFEKRKEAFIPKIQKWERAQGAVCINSDYQAFLNAKDVWESDVKERCQMEKTLQEMRSVREELQKEREKLKFLLKERETEAALSDVVPVLREQINSLNTLFHSFLLQQKMDVENWQRVISLRKKIAEEEVPLKEDEKKIQETEHIRKELEKKSEELLAGKEVGDIQREERSLKRYMEILASMEESVELYQKTREFLQKLAKRQKKLQDIFEIREKFCRQAEQKTEQLKEKLNHEKLKMNFARQRENLRPGQPCPLCGAKEHPYAEIGETVMQDEMKIKLNQAESAQKLEEKKRENTAHRLSLTKKQMRNQSNFFEEKESNFIELKEAFLEELREGQRKWEEELYGDGIQEYLELEVNDAHVLEIIKKKRQRFQLRKNGIQKIIAEIQQLHQKQMSIQKEVEDFRKILDARRMKFYEMINEESRLSGGIQTEKDNREKEQQKIILFRKNMWEKASPFITGKSLLPSEVSQLSEKLSDYSGRDFPEDHSDLARFFEEETAQWNALFQILFQREEERKKLERSFTEVENKLNVCEGQILLQENYKKERALKWEKDEADYRNAEMHWSKVLARSSFKDMQDFLDAQMEEAQRRSIEKTQKEMSAEAHALQEKIQENERKLAEEREKNFTEKTEDELKRQRERLSQAKDENLKKQGELHHEISRSRREQARYDQEWRKIQEKLATVNRWKKLNDLIGSKNGDKFKNFAQHLTFTALLRHANIFLRKISDRYVLLPSDKISDLDIHVLDNYQAGAVRTSKNLSGGETFLVSLSLALGLAAMAGKEVSMDTLFLDEGFGTLDEETLDVALNALGTIQQSGKIIGIISHVSALQERLTAQIKVTHVAQGRSEISGPGIRKIK
ncbi:MAG: SbcC/MukB-like Walker B domain-containing protein [Planctomycetia bacterium]|nr:SbcC/MukB-like Walker B domain-containing protein [Planctomycetia bacterium]